MPPCFDQVESRFERILALEWDYTQDEVPSQTVDALCPANQRVRDESLDADTYGSHVHGNGALVHDSVVLGPYVGKGDHRGPESIQTEFRLV